MNKYAVVEESDKDKVANDKKLCPDCGRELESKDVVNVSKCPSCGTKPFEKKDDDV